jgi:hypothetical protein
VYDSSGECDGKNFDCVSICEDGIERMTGACPGDDRPYGEESADELEDSTTDDNNEDGNDGDSGNGDGDSGNGDGGDGDEEQ